MNVIEIVEGCRQYSRICMLCFFEIQKTRFWTDMSKSVVFYLSSQSLLPVSFVSKNVHIYIMKIAQFDFLSVPSAKRDTQSSCFYEHFYFFFQNPKKSLFLCCCTFSNWLSRWRHRHLTINHHVLSVKIPVVVTESFVFCCSVNVYSLRLNVHIYKITWQVHTYAITVTVWGVTFVLRWSRSSAVSQCAAAYVSRPVATDSELYNLTLGGKQAHIAVHWHMSAQLHLLFLSSCREMRIADLVSQKRTCCLQGRRKFAKFWYFTMFSCNILTLFAGILSVKNSVPVISRDSQSR